MVLGEKWYTFLKWFVLVAAPAVTVCYCALAAIWDFPYADEVAKTSAAVCTLLGALLGISTAEYRKDNQ